MDGLDSTLVFSGMDRFFIDSGNWLWTGLLDFRLRFGFRGFSVYWVWALQGFGQVLNVRLSMDNQIQQYKDCCSFFFYVTFSIKGIKVSIFGQFGPIRLSGEPPGPLKEE